MLIVLSIQKGQPALLGISSTEIIFTKWQQLGFLAFYSDLILASGALRGIKLSLGRYNSSFRVRLSSSQAEPAAWGMFSKAGHV